MTAAERVAAAEMTVALSQRVDRLAAIDRADSYVGRHRAQTPKP
ncbi:hypothetical protein ACIBEJ_34625 [Nonomuraea sp. NPDC050790]